MAIGKLGNNALLKSPEARLVTHAFLMGLGIFLSLLLAANQPIDHALIISALAAGARAGLGLLTSTNPQVGANIL